MIKYQQAKYIMSAEKVSQLPEDVEIEVAFLGRSNVGKSSIINVLTDQKNLARVSKTPGRTRLINLFNISSNNLILVDLPGYGYAKVSKKVKKGWKREIEYYITQRDCLKGIVLLVDSRHELKEFDYIVVDTAISYNINLHILLTKADKLNNKQKSSAAQIVKSFLKNYKSNKECISYQLFSSLNKLGLKELKQKICNWCSK